MSEPPKGGKANADAGFDPGAFLRREARGHAAATYAKGAAIYAQGDPAESLYYLTKGHVKVTVVSGAGKEAVIGIRVPHEILGEECLAGEKRRLASASALTDCDMLRIENTEVQRLLRSFAAFSAFMIAQLLARNTKIQEDLIDQLFNSTERRLARLLLLLGRCDKAGRPEQIDAKISQEILAEMIGTTRSRVNHFMNKFRRLGMIDYNGHIKVNSALLSGVLTDQAVREITLS